MTRNDINARRRYTCIQTVGTCKPPIYIDWLNIGIQRFKVSETETKSEARWLQNQLAVALNNVIEENQP